MLDKPSLIAEVLRELGFTASMIASFIIAGTTSLVVYLNKVKNGGDFFAFSLLVNIAVSLTMAFLIDAIIRYANGGIFDSNLSKATMVVVGITSSKILELVEVYGSKYMEKKTKELYKQK